MTADEWTISTDPEAMLSALHDAEFSTTRLPVVLAGFAERGRLVPLLSPDLRQQFVGYARWVFGLGERPLPIELLMFDPLEPRGTDGYNAQVSLRHALTGSVAGWLEIGVLCRAEATGNLRGSWLLFPTDPTVIAFQRRQADALRDALGNPFDPVTWEPSWRSETAVALATGIHLDNAFDRLPILADALEEAGCDAPEVLAHCRGPGPHARGCWVVDAVRGRVL